LGFEDFNQTVMVLKTPKNRYKVDAEMLVKVTATARGGDHYTRKLEANYELF
jgi:uncharacterized lipoprotein YajG